MFRVIDTISWSEDMQQILASSGVQQLGNGLLVILDPAQINTQPIVSGGSVRVHYPDGKVDERTVTAVVVSHSVVGLFFADAQDHEIPRLSQIELIEATAR